MPPAACLDAGNWNFERRFRRNQDRRVQNAVLLEADQDLAVDHQNRDVRARRYLQSGYGAGRPDFGDLRAAIFLRVRKGHVLERGAVVEDGQ